MNKQDIQMLYEYNRWANGRILDTTAKISEAQFLAPASFPYGGLRGTLVHTLFTEWIWRLRWQGAPYDFHLKPDDFPTFASLRTCWLEEERRLFYVGITRAKARLYITHAFRRSRFGGTEPSAPSSFLAAIPANSLAAGSRSHEPARSTSRKLLVPEPAATPVWTRVEPGQRVFHAKFGDGVVVKVVDRGDDQEITVEFKRHGQKRLMGSLANLTVDEE